MNKGFQVRKIGGRAQKGRKPDAAYFAPSLSPAYRRTNVVGRCQVGIGIESVPEEG